MMFVSKKLVRTIHFAALEWASVVLAQMMKVVRGLRPLPEAYSTQGFKDDK
jgi:hypothetical protein